MRGLVVARDEDRAEHAAEENAQRGHAGVGAPGVRGGGERLGLGEEARLGDGRLGLCGRSGLRRRVIGLGGLRGGGRVRGLRGFGRGLGGLRRLVACLLRLHAPLLSREAGGDNLGHGAPGTALRDHPTTRLGSSRATPVGSMTSPCLRRRASGLLLHPTSLPGAHGSGDLGAEAIRFVEFLASAGQRVWQMLPVGPPGFGNSPYSAASAFAGSPLLLSLEGLADAGFLDPGELAEDPLLPGRIDWGVTIEHRERYLAKAAARFAEAPAARRAPILAYRAREAGWLEDYALYSAIKRAQGGGPWIDWPDELRAREPDALARARRDLAGDIERAVFEQWAFDAQWSALREACHRRGVALIGDVPIFVAHDSADVWQHQDLFHLDRGGRPTVVAGVPPDYFSATGQRWGNPLYRWKRMRARGFDWWIERFRVTLSRFDAIRLDHFIGFSRNWEIPADEPTAIVGRWRRGPGAKLFDAAKAALGELPIIAEDLGLVTPAVRRLRRRYRFPGLRILQFAFGTDPQAPSFLPHAHVKNSVVYTGTHDNDTIVGWYRDRGDAQSRTPAAVQVERNRALAYLHSDGADIHWDFIRAGLQSVARLSVFPVQDVLGLGSEARMNLPGTSERIWEFRLDAAALTPAVGARLLDLT